MTQKTSTLLVDMGNSRIKWASLVGSDRRVGEPFANRGADTDFATLEAIPRPQHIAIANSAGEACASIFATWCARVWSMTPRFLRAQENQGSLQNGYTHPEALGVDRWLAMLAARQTVTGAFAVVDCGTAITVDAVGSDGHFLGGVICAGPASTLRALTDAVEHLQAGQIDYQGVLNVTTASALTSGALIFSSGGIERVLSEFEATLGKEMRVLITGGDSEPIAGLIRRPVEQRPHLVLEGIQWVVEQRL